MKTGMKIDGKWNVSYCSSQLAITCSKLTIKTQEQGVKFVQS